MSRAANVRRRPSIWSYFSFTSSPARKQSISLPTRSALDDPYEKPNRHANTANGSPVANLKNAWMTQSQRSRYIKAGGIIAFVLLIFFFLAPADNRASVGKIVGDHAPHLGNQGGQVPTDSSYGTSKCPRSSSTSKPIIQYAIMIDAGSTGSRIHVYRFNNCGETPELEKEFFKMTEKKKGGSGLSSYKDDPEEAAKSLDPLLKFAMENVPDKLKACTPIAVKATAGLRMVGMDLAQKILDAVRERLEKEYPFAVVAKDKHGVEIMDGKDEGVYAWITTNYLLGKIGAADNGPTVATFDLGGGSTQIVFEPTFKSPSHGMPEKLEEGDNKYELDFGGRKFALYQHSHLGYGLMEARNGLHKLLLDNAFEANGSDKNWQPGNILNPCILPGMSEKIEIRLGDDHPLGKKLSVTMMGPKEGSGTNTALCRSHAEKLLQKQKQCELQPCSFNGVYQPSLAKTFAKEDVYIFSYFYDRTEVLGMPESFTIKELKDLAEKVCNGEKSWDTFSSVKGALEELKGRPQFCLDLNFMVALLHTGYEMPLDREVKIAKKINGNELGWCLGASLPLLSQSSGWKCRVKEVPK